MSEADAHSLIGNASALRQSKGPISAHQQGIAEFARGDHQAAIASFRAAIEELPGAPWSYLALGEALAESGVSTEAADAYRSALERMPPNAVALRESAAKGLTRAGDVETAIAVFRGILADEPTRATSALGLARALLARADELAEEAAQLVIDAEDLGSDQELVDAVIEAVPPRRAVLYRRLASSLALRGDRIRALTAIQLAFAHDPDDPCTLSVFTEFLAGDEFPGGQLSTEQREWVLDLAERAVLADPDNGQSLLHRARLRSRHGPAAEAVEAWRAVVEHEPQNALWHRELGDLLAAAGRFDEAGVEYERAVALGYDVY